MNLEMVNHLKRLANRECFSDDEDEDVTVDAFYLGVTEGDTALTRDILKNMGIEW